jgi:hypothetical protein
MPNKMTKRLAVYLPDGIYEFLEEWAGEERRSISNLAAVLLELMARDREGWLLANQITERTQTETPTPTAISTKAKRSKGTQQQNGGSDD